MKDLKKVKKAYTHSGCMHADEIFGAALLKLINPDIEIIRVPYISDYDDGDDTIIFDIGGGQYDHHQTDNEVRENGIPYASFGKLWRDFGNALCSKRVVNIIDKIFVQYMDSTDNGYDNNINLLSMVFRSFNPTWNEKDTVSGDRKFFEAVNIAKTILKNIIDREISSEIAYQTVGQCIVKDSNYAILHTFMPFEKALVDYNNSHDHKIEFVLFPSNREGWNVQCVPKCMGGKEYYKRIPDCTDFTSFVHKNRFLASCKTLIDALKLIEQLSK